MGELVLRKIQAGIEATRGTPVAATKKLYGTMTMTRAQAKRFAVEDRGVFTDKFRANPKLPEAGFVLAADATFEDLPLYLATFLNGAASSSGSAGIGYTWAVNPDTTDALKTLTLEAGDDTVAWQGAFGTVDSADLTLALDDALTASLTGFVADWIPQSYAVPGLPTAFAGFTGSLAERVVESVMGYQSHVFIDPTGTAVGTTPVTGRFIAATIGIHNQNKRKVFGDGTYGRFSRLGRGRRQVTAQITFEALDTNQYADFYNNVSKGIRIQLLGGPIASTTFGATNGALASGSTITAITTSALSATIPGGTGISVGGQTFSVTIVGAASGATSIPVQSQKVEGTIATTTTVMAAKTINMDLYGVWDAFVIGARDTNTTFQFTLQGVYDTTAAKECAITVVNGQTAL